MLPDLVKVYDPEPLAVPRQGSIPENNSDAWYCKVGSVLVFLHSWPKWRILEHAYATPKREVGGALLGTTFVDAHLEGVAQIIEITSAIPGNFTRGSSARLTFTVDTWSDILRVKESEHPDEQIVGWYHTHPNWGIFLSDLDQWIQDNFFDQLDQVALVIDPIREIGGFFHGTTKQPGGISSSFNFSWDKRLYGKLLAVRAQSRPNLFRIFANPLAGLKVRHQPTSSGRREQSRVEFRVTSDDILKLAKQGVRPEPEVEAHAEVTARTVQKFAKDAHAELSEKQALRKQKRGESEAYLLLITMVSAFVVISLLLFMYFLLPGVASQLGPLVYRIREMEIRFGPLGSCVVLGLLLTIPLVLFVWAAGELDKHA